jgi:predicted RNase H-like nuclease (RuvC/YqgF family)
MSSVEFWIGILGSGVVTGVVGWIFGGKQQKAKDLKKADVEIDTAEIDYAEKVRLLYENINGKLLQQIESIRAESQVTIEELKKDREELKEANRKQDVEIAKLRNDFKEIDKKFHDLYLAYAKEVESSKYWKEKFDDLDKKYTDLMKDHEELKKQFENYKKAHK